MGGLARPAARRATSSSCPSRAAAGRAVTGLKHIDQILAEKPDCVVWEYGANEMINGHIDSYVKSTTAAVEKLKAAGIEVVLQTVTPTADLSPHNWLGNKSMPEYGGKLSAETKRIAKENGCAVADMHAALSARGLQFMGDLCADFVHLNHLGHEMFADVLDALFTDRDVRIWRWGPGRREGEVGPVTPPAGIVGGTIPRRPAKPYRMDSCRRTETEHFGTSRPGLGPGIRTLHEANQ